MFVFLVSLVYLASPYPKLCNHEVTFKNFLIITKNVVAKTASFPDPVTEADKVTAERKQSLDLDWAMWARRGEGKPGLL